ncbi:GNAT family N-acetyltransferase [Devosia rhodophyticola]|uniref:Aminoglycoside N(6')-acetyltransferase type 1 n=1 Tax=Devosia rhodophyticola TaxID=3026423 RepID=A0ABY7Z1A1_9HYPH|nr:aminoglycoside 6'-N-acetyltransferase [Devosia rhodophyticola]WDR07063.1 GNAT family N-acetyltransferase [Devosia rhodophyticola]
MPGILVEEACTHDLPDWVAMRKELWPETSLADHHVEATQMLEDNSDRLNLLVRTSDGAAAGFVEASIRHDYVNGCQTSPVGFLEGIYVRNEFRRQGIARHLMELAAEWTRARGCKELASDASISNFVSHQMHHTLGFEETQRVVYFRKVVA